jgi:hypothetical protein
MVQNECKMPLKKNMGDMYSKNVEKMPKSEITPT